MNNNLSIQKCIENIFETIRNNCPKNLKDIEQYRYKTENQAILELINGSTVSGFTEYLNVGDIKNDILIGFIAEDECSFTIEYSFQKIVSFNLKKGEFSWAFLDTIFPSLACQLLDAKVVSVKGLVHALYAVLDTEPRKLIMFNPFYLTENIYISKANIYHINTESGEKTRVCSTTTDSVSKSIIKINNNLNKAIIQVNDYRILKGC